MIIKCAIATISLIFSLASSLCTANSSFTVTLLGTGTTEIDFKRFGPSTLVEIENKLFLFDTGRGAAIRLSQIDRPRELFSRLQQIFLTHLHSDHVVGLPDIYMTGWIMHNDKKLTITGPPGTAAMLNHLRQAFERDIYFRHELDTKYSALGLDVVVNEITNEMSVFDQDGIKITAFLVDHGEIRPAFGYKIEALNKKVVLSGDTKYSQDVIEQAKNADLIIHEVSLASPQYVQQLPQLKQVLSHHTLPEQAGQVFEQAKVKHAVYNHVWTLGISKEELLQQTRKHYHGPLYIGQDLMQFSIGDTVEIASENLQIHP